jgi:hypothetical protein
LPQTVKFYELIDKSEIWTKILGEVFQRNWENGIEPLRARRVGEITEKWLE